MMALITSNVAKASPSEKVSTTARRRRPLAAALAAKSGTAIVHVYGGPSDLSSCTPTQHGVPVCLQHDESVAAG